MAAADSTVPAGHAVLELLRVMDRLRSPGGCPWDAEQTHASLVPYLLEEAHEAAEAIESGDRDHMIEELGDVLLQVVFQARVGQDDSSAPFDIDDIASVLIAKLRRRHPHVFGEAEAADAAAVETNWERIKEQERHDKHAADGGAAPAGPLDGIPAGMPSLLRAAKVVARLDRVAEGRRSTAVDATVAAGGTGAELLGVVAAMVREGDDPDAALRAALRDVGNAAG
ncbi:MAG: MazG family protein [Dermatophilaceae bacterium]